MTNNPPQSISINVSLSDIYACLCPECKTALLDLLGEKAAAQGLRDVFRRQLDSSCHSERSEESPPAPV